MFRMIKYRAIDLEKLKNGPEEINAFKFFDHKLWNSEFEQERTGYSFILSTIFLK